jgi:hypothetical protein
MTSDIPEAIFLLHKNNVSYLAGQNRHPASLRTPNSDSLFYMFLGLLVGLIALVWAYTDYRDYVTLRDDGRIVEGNMTDTRMISGKSDTYYLTYEFVVREGRYVGTYTREQQVKKDLYDRFEPRKAIPILYDPNDPSLSVVAETNSPPYVETAVGVISLLIGAGVGAWGFYELKGKMQLATEGQLIYGEITKCSGRNERHGSYVAVRYLFVSPETGKQIRQKTRKIRNDLRKLGLPQPGTAVAIMYRDDEHHAML